jgi:hypothetical protein
VVPPPAGQGRRGAAHASARGAERGAGRGQVRVWGVARSVAELRAGGFLDTAAPGASGLRGYWPFDDPALLHACADEARVARDAALPPAPGGGTLGRAPAQLEGSGAALVLSDVPLDRPAAFSATLPADGATLTVHLGATLTLHASAADPNPSDLALLRLELPGAAKTHPTGATYSDVVAQGAFFSWAPLPRDAGKSVELCFSLTNAVANPLRPDFVLEPRPQRTCVTLRVPLCKYQASEGDSLRSIAARFRTTWRALFLVNPELGHPDALAAGMVIRVGSLYSLDAQDSLRALVATVRASWGAVANHNNALLYRLWTDQYALRDAAAAARPLASLEAGQGVYDIDFASLDRLHNYSVSAPPPPLLPARPRPVRPRAAHARRLRPGSRVRRSAWSRSSAPTAFSEREGARERWSDGARERARE